MIHTDPLSLVFIGCAVFSGAFLVISTLLGVGESHLGHLGHVGGHDVGHDFGHDTGHAIHHDIHIGGHADAGHAGHADGAHAAHAHADAHGESSATQTAAAHSIWSSIGGTLLGALYLYGLLMFLLIFGLVGYVAHALLSWGVIFVIVVPLLIGVICAIGLTTLLHALFATSKDTVLTADDARLEGRLGSVTIPIRAGGIGEIIFTRKGGGRQSVGARSATGEAIPAGSEIVILDYLDGIASVQTWDSFLFSARAGDPLEQLAPIEPIKPATPANERKNDTA
jgi:membrane protein implicated in regulation of membrane protease activity